MALIMPQLSEAAARIAVFEGFRSNPYRDSVGIWTIGYGTTHYPDGRAVTGSDAPITMAEGIAFLEHDLTDTAVHLWKFVVRQPTLNQWSAMLSLAYNEGWPAISRSTLLRLFNQGSSRAADQFVVWDKARRDGQLVEIAGLKTRRIAERTLFLSPAQ